MKTITLDTLTLTNYASGNGFLVGSIEGLEAPAINVSLIPKSGTDGIIVPTAYARERRITINGALVGKCKEDIIANRQLISALVPPIRNSVNVIQPLTLYLTDFDDSTYRVDVVVAGLSMGRQDILKDAYQLDLIATDWRILSGGTENSDTMTQGEYGGFSLDFEIPFSFEGGTDVIKNITNAGNAPAPLRWTLTGEATNPALTNTTTGDTIQINTTVGVGDTLEVDMGEHTIMLNGSSIIGSLDDDSTFWELAVGVNALTLATAVTSETPTVTLFWRDAYGGI